MRHASNIKANRVIMWITNSATCNGEMCCYLIKKVGIKVAENVTLNSVDSTGAEIVPTFVAIRHISAPAPVGSAYCTALV